MNTTQQSKGINFWHKKMWVNIKIYADQNPCDKRPYTVRFHIRHSWKSKFI